MSTYFCMRLFSWSCSVVSSTICFMCCLRSCTCSSSLWQCRLFSNTWTRGRSESRNEEFWIILLGRTGGNKRQLGVSILKRRCKVLFSSMFHQKSCLLGVREGRERKNKELWRKETTKQQQREHLTGGCVIVLGQFLEERIKKKNNMGMVLGNWLLCEGWVKGIDLFSSVIHEWAGEIKWARF